MKFQIEEIRNRTLEHVSSSAHHPLNEVRALSGKAQAARWPEIRNPKQVLVLGLGIQNSMRGFLRVKVVSLHDRYLDYWQKHSNSSIE